jgi:ATP-binding cassette subfamily B protein
LSQREFTINSAYDYNRSGSVRWLLSHFWRYKYVVACFLLLSLAGNILGSTISILTGSAFTVVLQGAADRLISIMLTLLVIAGLNVFMNVGCNALAALLGQLIARDARDELYLGLLGKSQTFHNRQRVGDLMARAANDTDQLSAMVLPGILVTFEAFSGFAIMLIFVVVLNVQLLLVPLLYLACLLVLLRPYLRQLHPIAEQMREHFGQTNAVLNEAVTGIEVVKATAQEEQELQKFGERASRFRDFFVQNGLVEGRYIPILLLGIFLVLAFLHGLYLLSRGEISPGTLISFMTLIGILNYVTEVPLYGFSLIQSGVAGARRILDILLAETELDENEQGHQAVMHGDVVFENVAFRYGGEAALKHISFHARAGQTIAIVGETGSGKSTLTKLINRIYDASEGRVLIDGIDVRDWNLDALRSQISTIEQDVFLFSRMIAENIAYGLGDKADRAAIEAAARDAQAHNFIMAFKDGYETLVGERGVTLSGGQRQRIAIARALLTDPRILILDDATSAIDSATEDEIQQAIQRVLQGRTTFLITHRLSQIRRADYILVMQGGELLDQGTHHELLLRCEIYRRMFSHYEHVVSIDS